MAQPSYILSLDQGTTGSTAAIFDQNLRVVATDNQPFEQHFPRPGWVEHDGQQIWQSMVHAIKAVTQNTKAIHIDAIGITNQRETVLPWRKSTGKPLHHAIVWQCRRTQSICQTLKKQGLEPHIQKTTGLLLDPYFSGTKIQWLLQNVPEVAQAHQENDLCIGTIDAFLVFQLTGGQAYVTDRSNASRTQLMNIKTGQWDPDMFATFQVPESVLPTIVGNAEVVGHTKGHTFLPDGIPIAGMAGDQQAALFGQQCYEPGQAKCTYGTGAFLLANTGTKPLPSANRLLTTVAWTIADQTHYALEGSVFMAGAVVQWLRDGLGIIDRAQDVEALANTVPDNGGVFFLPAFTGLGAPHWLPDVRGEISGLTRGTTRAHIARAALEGIALQVYDLVQAFESDMQGPIKALAMDGGASQNKLLMNIQASLLQWPINVSQETIEATAKGAAMLAAIGIGWVKPYAFDHIKPNRQTITPSIPPDTIQAMLNQWQQGINARQKS
jgi:glycerol kinase